MTSPRYKYLIESVRPLPEGAISRRILYRTAFPKKIRKKGEEVGARAAASEPGQQLLKKLGALGVPSRVASKLKVRMLDLKKKLKGAQ